MQFIFLQICNLLVVGCINFEYFILFLSFKEIVQQHFSTLIIYNRKFQTMKVADIILHLEQLAPLAYQESYDNSGLLVGNANRQVSKILVSLDCTELVVDEAIEMGCNMVVSHHPIVFKGLKKFTGSNYIERTVEKAIKNDIVLYAIHTNLDNVMGGVNYKIASLLGLQNVQMLSPKSNLLKKLTVFCPKEATEKVKEKLHLAGAGQIGNYQNCSFSSSGIGSFTPSEVSNPYIGSAKIAQTVEEDKLEIIFPANIEKKVLAAMYQSHPYEEVAYFLQNLENKHTEIGSGAVGELIFLGNEKEFYDFIKITFDVPFLKHTATTFANKKSLKIAVCGGSGIFLMPEAMRHQADVFITSDVKYHEFFDAENKITLVDIGHYESEICTKKLLFDNIKNKFVNIAVLLSNIVTNPVKYQ